MGNAYCSDGCSAQTLRVKLHTRKSNLLCSALVLISNLVYFFFSCLLICLFILNCFFFVFLHTLVKKGTEIVVSLWTKGIGAPVIFLLFNFPLII